MRQLGGLGLIVLAFVAFGALVQFMPPHVLLNYPIIAFPVLGTSILFVAFSLLFGLFMVFANDKEWGGVSDAEKKGA